MFLREENNFKSIVRVSFLTFINKKSNKELLEATNIEFKGPE